MEFFSLAVGRLLDYTLAPIGRQVGYVIFYQRNVNELKKEAVALQLTRERVQHEVDAAKRNGELIEGDVQKWLEEVDDTVSKAGKLNKDERHTVTGCSSFSFPNLPSRHQLSRQSKKMKQEIIEIKLKGNFGRVSYREVPNLMAASSSTTGSKEFLSRISILNDIMKALEDSNLHTIGMYGLGGVGKTTLAKEVAKRAQQDKLFHVVVLATVTQNPDTKEIQGQIADKIGLKFEEESTSGRADRLRNTSNMKEERVLLILDDLWAELKLDEIGIPSVEQHKSLKILMTSRSLEVLSDEMNIKKNFLVQVLPKLEAWKLFMDKAQFDESVVSGELLSIATQVAEECAGLPIALVTIASSF